MTRTILFSFLNSPPTFKTATPTSRTQLKLQLMREQLQQQERREAELKQQQLQRRAPSLTPALKVPVSIQSVDVPPQVLQVSNTIALRFVSIMCNATF
jgi:cell shape-determining protein MreC